MSEPNKTPEEKAKELGLYVVRPNPNELFVDIDNEYSFAVFEKQFVILSQMFPNARFQVTASKSGHPRRHVIVSLPEPITIEQRILLQACLGSDVKRELLSYRHYKNHQTDATCFFEKPYLLENKASATVYSDGEYT